MSDLLKQPAVILTILGGLITLVAGVFIALENERSTKDLKELGKKNLELSGELREMSSKNGELINQLALKSSEISELSKKNIELSEIINKRSIDEAVKLTLERAIASRVAVLDRPEETNVIVPKVYLGDAEISASASIIGSSDGNHPFRAWIENKRLMTKIVLQDSKRETYATINGSTVKIFNETGIDYNYDNKAYEIVRGDGRVLFQMELVQDVVRVAGLFCTQGVCMYFTKQGMKLAGGTNDRFPLPLQFDIEPIFRYPREQYLHVRKGS